MAATQPTILQVALVVCLLSSAHGFQPLLSFDGKSATHRDITQRAILRKTAEVCQFLAAAEGRDFSLEINDRLTVFEVQKACSTTGTSTSLISTIMFQSSIVRMYFSNAAVDIILALSEEHHFDDETFQGGRDVITAGVSAVKASVKRENFVSGRLILGQVCHTLQDFYSHSNWVEMGKKAPYSLLIQPDQPLENLAGPSTPTCRNCIGEDCTDNLLPELLQQGLLTSGYFNIFSSAKPTGKCSHGGSADRTSKQEPVGGINKDAVGSSHGHLHQSAANLAVNATMELLEDIRSAVGEKDFLRLMGLSQSSVLCFVIDTTGSMSDDIAEAKRVSFSIIDSRRGTQQEPSAYILVPFNDPDFGPLITTSNADVFKDRINELSAKGGGDLPEMCLSGLQLALTAAPSSSDIFVFTDAAAKDAHLKSTITALIESTQSVVTFLLTDVLSRRNRRESKLPTPRALAQADAQLYRDLAEVSGGQAIEVTKADLALATAVIEDSSATAVVTVYHAAVNPGKPANFTFTVDGTMRNLTVYITGSSSLSSTLTAPTGVSQSSSQSSGPLGSFSTVGNLHRLSLSADNQTGSWGVSVNSDDPYSLKVIAQSPVNFLFNIVEAHEGAHGDFSLKEGRPLTGGNVSLWVTVTGSNTTAVTEATLVESSGSPEVNGSVQSLGGGSFLVTFYSVPEGEFVLRLTGEDSATSRSTKARSTFQRQASTRIKSSSISVTVQDNSTTIEPGSTIYVTFTVTITADGIVNDTASGIFTIQATNDQNYGSTMPTTVSIAEGKANGTITLTAPSTAASGTVVTLTIEAKNQAGGDSNYAIRRLFVDSKVKDVTRPVCNVVSTSGTCPSSSSRCGSAVWTFVANLTDGINGTGIERVTLRKGNGTLNTSTAVGTGNETILLATYTASCCLQNVELLIVDKAGNARTCVGQAKTAVTSSAAPVTTSTAPVTTSAAPVTTTNVTSGGGQTMTLSRCLWITVMASLLWMGTG
ncbi:von Willebrand factor A domain-containing protein 7-like [Lampris incognitus]|uniref:von Willebrand factor A domain-containing protein 7-like n=1 Tax=Lampris incognitus TaxID=2546036 RepID=UPI0024B56F53|nr:von Willebrand factor A domain-containing protein 7-like [Lampris incognitus]